MDVQHTVKYTDSVLIRCLAGFEQGEAYLRRLIIWLFVLALLGTGGYFGYQEYLRRQTPPAPEWEVVPVRRANIKATVSATGAVLAERDVNLSFTGTGLIARVTAKVGDQVEQGAVLAQLDTAELELAVRQAELGVRSAEAQLRQLKVGPSESDIAAAQATLNSARASYQQLTRGSDADQLAAARAQVEQARVQLEQAQQAYDVVKNRPEIGMLPQSLQLQQATIAYDTAQAQFRVTSRGANESQLIAAQAQIVQAQANLDKLQRGPNPEQIEVSQTAVEQAKLTLEQARRRVDNARITAPWAGVVTAVNVAEGGAAQVTQPAFRLVDTSRYHVNVQVDEVDIASIIEGQPVTVELDALPGAPLSGRVDKIAPIATTETTGVVTYRVTVNLDPTDVTLRAGMSATTNITSSDRRDVLLVPNRAVQIDRNTGATIVERLVDGQPQKVEVRIGVRDDQQSEVRAGLADNDEVIIRTVTSLEQLQQRIGF